MVYFVCTSRRRHTRCALGTGVQTCALSISGYPVRGPLDVIGADGRGTRPGWEKPVGSVSAQLESAIAAALQCDRNDCARYARYFSWDACVDQFVSALAGCAGLPVVPVPVPVVSTAACERPPSVDSHHPHVLEAAGLGRRIFGLCAFALPPAHL